MHLKLREQQFKTASYIYIHIHTYIYMGYQVALVLKNPPVKAGNIRDLGSIPGLKAPLGKDMATHSSSLVWRILWTEESGRSMELQRVRHD